MSKYQIFVRDVADSSLEQVVISVPRFVDRGMDQKSFLQLYS